MGAVNPVNLIDALLLKKAAPEGNIGELALWAGPIQKACSAYEINNVRRVAGFIAQMAHESGGFVHMTEDLNYSAQRLTVVWPKRFPTLAAAAPYAHNPEKLANKTYANRNGNGNEASGDGWRFRGCCPLQVTGREAWAGFAAHKGMTVDAALEYGRTRDGGADVSGWWWLNHGINRLADTPGVEDETRAINGGTNGMVDRETRFNTLVTELIRRGA